MAARIKPHAPRRTLRWQHGDRRSRAVAVLANPSTILTTLLAVVLGVVFKIVGQQPVIYDASGYYEAALSIIQNGLTHWPNPLRTYGYPLFLVPWVLFNRDDREQASWIVFWVQISMHVLIYAYVARRISDALFSGMYRRTLLTMLLLNPFTIITTTVLLTESVSTAIVALSLVLVLPAPATGQRSSRIDMICSMVGICLATVIRPSNAVFVPLVILLWIVRSRAGASLTWRSWSVASMLSILVFLPQVYINMNTYRQFSLLLTSSLYQDQLKWGTQFLKYATMYIPNEAFDPQAFYVNPLRPQHDDVVTFIWNEPIGFVLTSALHVFGLIDQDFLFVFIRDLSPWYRWPFSILSYVFFLLVLLGLPALWRLRHRGGPGWLALVTLTLSPVAYLLVFLPTAVESRFGVPLFPLLTPHAVFGLDQIGRWIRARSWPPLATAGALGTALVVAACWLSIWMQRQAPNLVAMRAYLSGPPPELPVARFDVMPPTGWEAAQESAYTVRVTNVGREPWRSKSPARVQLAVQFTADGDPDHYDRSSELRLALPNDLAPNETLSMDVKVRAPRNPGTYLIVHRPYLEVQQGTWSPSMHTTEVMVAPAPTRRRGR